MPNYTRADFDNLFPERTRTNNSVKHHHFNQRCNFITRVRPVLSVAVLSCLAAGSGGADSFAVVKNAAMQQLEFGVKVAMKGSWNEAAFRFQRAIKLGGASPRVYNNLAVAQESLGQFELARESYEKAIAMEKAGSEDERIRENYDRLISFLKSNHPAPAAP